MIRMAFAVVGWMIALVVLLSGCSDPDAGLPAEGVQYSTGLPVRIQPRALPGECANNIVATLQLDDQAPAEMLRDENAMLWSSSLTSLSLGLHRFQLTFSCASAAYGELVLARAEQHVELVAGSNEISFPESLFVFEDWDKDGVSNLEEIESGTNPLPSGEIETYSSVRSVSPLDRASGVDPAATIRVNFSKSVNADSITAHSLVLLADGDPVPGESHLDATNSTLVFEPEKPLGLLTEYTVKLSAAVRFQDGSVLADKDLSWRFRTQDGRWQTAVYVSGQPDSQDPAVAVSESGDAVAVWRKGSNQVWSRSFSGKRQRWEELSQVTDPEALSVAVTDISVKLSPKGTLAVTSWRAFGGRSSIFYICTSSSRNLESWTYKGCFDELGVDQDQAFLSTGAAVIVWARYPKDQPLTGVPYRDIAAAYLDRMWSSRWQGVGLIEGSVNTTADAPKVAADGKGAASVVWIDEDANQQYTVWATRFVNNQWAPSATALSTGPFDYDTFFDSDAGGYYYYRNQPVIAADKGGNVVAAWLQGNTEIYVARFDADVGAWSAANNIYRATAGVKKLSVGTDAVGNVLLLWLTDREIRAARYSVFWNAWFDAGAAIAKTESGAFRDVQVEMDDAGNALAIWVQYADAGGKSGGDIYVARYSRLNNRWDAPIIIDRQVKSATDPKIAMWPDGRAFAVWASDGEIYASQFK